MQLIGVLRGFYILGICRCLGFIGHMAELMLVGYLEGGPLVSMMIITT